MPAAFTPVYRLAKPKNPNVNEQGVPIRQNPLPSKAKQKTPSSTRLAPSTQYQPLRGQPTEPEEEFSLQPESMPSGPQYIPNSPEVASQPFHHLEDQVFPVSELGIDSTSLLDPSGWGSDAPLHFAESIMGESRPHSDRAERMRQIIESAYHGHNVDNSVRMHQDKNAKNTDIPVGHAKIGPLAPGLAKVGHIVSIHYPQGVVTTYRARLDKDGNSYR